MFTNCHTHFSSYAQTEIHQVEMNQMVSHFHSLGVHPWKAGDLTIEKAMELIQFSRNDNTLALGECGLDALKGPEMPLQEKMFEAHVELSESIELPLIIHCVKAWNELQRVHKRMQPKQPWVFHGFSKLGILDQVVATGLMVSLGAGLIHHPKAKELVVGIPNEQLLLETDDQSIEIREVYECVARLKGISLQQLNEIVTSNFKNTFRKWQIG